MENNDLELININPDGFCILNSLLAVWGYEMGSMYSILVKELKKALNDPKHDLYALLYTWDSSMEETLYCITHLEQTWGSDMADPLMEVACYIMKKGVTVLEENGKAYPLRGGGAVIVHVSAPHPHYHATAPQ